METGKLTFKSKIFEDIALEGAVSLTCIRKFKAFRNFTLYISEKDQTLLLISTQNSPFRRDCSVSVNKTGFKIEIENDKSILFNGERYQLKPDLLYPFKKKYADVLLEKRKLGELQFKHKGLLTLEIDFVSESTVRLSKDQAVKISILTLLNIADLDGSE